MNLTLTDAIHACQTCGKGEADGATFSRDNSHRSGFCRTCKECRARYAKQYGKKNRAHLREYRKTWDEKNTGKRGGYDATYRAIGNPAAALKDGKISPICRARGFVLVRRTIRPAAGLYSARFRAVAVGHPMEAGENLVAVFAFSAPANRWVCSAPPLKHKSPEDAELCRRLIARHVQSAKKGGQK